jgi:DNA-directed RNA polymerase specialized sigma24 family protein
MSAVLQLPFCEASTLQAAWQIARWRNVSKAARTKSVQTNAEPEALAEETLQKRIPRPPAEMAVYRKPTEKLLRRYLYTSMQIGRSPSILSEPVARGWASSHPVHTFEDAAIFVLDIESCLSQIPSLDREILSKIVIQEYTQIETAVLLGIGARHITNRFGLALDRLSEKLLASGLLVIPHS